jgi:very-short-patch-repair endonuclease
LGGANGNANILSGVGGSLSFSSYKRLSDWKQARQVHFKENPSKPEARLLKQLRKLSKSHKLRFRHQHPCLGYILDFYLPSRKLAIEVDGKKFHNPEADAKRDQIIQYKLGIKTIRFSAWRVLYDLGFVIDEIIREAESRPVFKSWLTGTKQSTLPGVGARSTLDPLPGEKIKFAKRKRPNTQTASR